MTASQTVAIGDIHGCAKSIESLLKKIHRKAGTTRPYIFLGDYTDRGPDSKSVIDLLLEFSETHECIFLRGNHDQMLLDAYENEDWKPWLSNGGFVTLDSYESTTLNFKLPEEHYKFFHNTRLYWQNEEYFFVHAGLRPELTIKQNLKTDETHIYLWERAHIQSAHNEWEKTVVFGHTPVKEPIDRDNMLGIDTGCVYPDKGYGILTAVLLPEKKFIEQECLDF